MPEQIASAESRRIAMLIDGDNAQSSLFEKMIAETGKFGLVTIRRIYGDWTTNDMNVWKAILNLYAIQPVQQFRNTVGKNATDSAMIIDAMDILYEGVVSGFCLASSDSDYTRLATRIREKGFFVMGIGRRETPKAFVNACEVFVYTENLGSEVETPKTVERSRQEKAPKNAPPDPLPLLRKAFDISVQEDGWAFLGTVGSQLRQLDPGFDARTYGYRHLSQLIESHPNEFETKKQKGQGGTSAIYIKHRETRKK